MSFWRPYGLSVHDPLHWQILHGRFSTQALHGQGVFAELVHPRPLSDIADALRHVPIGWRNSWCDAVGGCACLGAANCSGANAILKAGRPATTEVA